MPTHDPDVESEVPRSASEDAAQRRELSGASGSAPTRMIGINSLRIGSRISQDIYDRAGVLLLAAGGRITSRFLHLLRQRGVRSVGLQPISPVDSVKIKEIDDLLAVELAKRAPPGARAPVQRPGLSVDDLRSEAQRGLERCTAASAELAEMYQTLQKGHNISGDKVQELVGEFRSMLTLDCDLLATIISMRKTLGEYLFDHCVNVALLSMSIASQLGLDHEQILGMGLGAVLLDVGMLRVPERIRLAPRDLTSDEWVEVLHHPVYTLNHLERIRGLPAVARFVGYQAHERADGTGYPRGRSAMTTHPFARIVAVADVYAAMTGPRPHRAPILPHKAIKELLVDVRRDRFDRSIVRAFLDRVSAYPIGSLVELPKGVVGRVIRANPGAHTQPVVVVLKDDGTPTDWVIDLAKDARLKVVRAVSATGGPI